MCRAPLPGNSCHTRIKVGRIKSFSERNESRQILRETLGVASIGFVADDFDSQTQSQRESKRPIATIFLIK